jgi:predicted DNA-binding transcriptional regulator AlpA
METSEKIPKRYTTKEIAQMYGLNPLTLQQKRCHRTGPHYEKIGRFVRYRIEDVEDWIARCTKDNAKI